MEREYGFYWVSDGENRIVAQWYKEDEGEGCWLIPGNEGIFDDCMFTNINENKITE